MELTVTDAHQKILKCSKRENTRKGKKNGMKKRKEHLTKECSVYTFN